MFQQGFDASMIRAAAAFSPQQKCEQVRRAQLVRRRPCAQIRGETFAERARVLSTGGKIAALLLQRAFRAARLVDADAFFKHAVLPVGKKIEPCRYDAGS